MRIGHDCIGKLAIDGDALYGIHSKRAANNFPISSEKIHPLIIESFLQIKKAAAQVNQQAGTLKAAKANAIIRHTISCCLADTKTRLLCLQSKAVLVLQLI